jgi:hypothetical protein
LSYNLLENLICLAWELLKKIEAYVYMENYYCPARVCWPGYGKKIIRKEHEGEEVP